MFSLKIIKIYLASAKNLKHVQKIRNNNRTKLKAAEK